VKKTSVSIASSFNPSRLQDFSRCTLDREIGVVGLLHLAVGRRGDRDTSGARF
jgi:hypothetical protein